MNNATSTVWGILSLTIINAMSCSKTLRAVEFHCPGDIINIGLSIKGTKPCDYCEIPRKFFRNGIEFYAADTSVRIIELIVNVARNNSVIYRKKIFGKQVSAREIRKIDGLRVGDLISTQCVRVEKNGKIALSTSMILVVIP